MKETNIAWSYPDIGTCGNECDILRVILLRARAVPDLLLKFDGERNGWVVGGSFRKAVGDDFEFREVAFIPEDDLDEERFLPDKEDAESANERATP